MQASLDDIGDGVVDRIIDVADDVVRCRPVAETGERQVVAVVLDRASVPMPEPDPVYTAFTNEQRIGNGSARRMRAGAPPFRVRPVHINVPTGGTEHRESEDSVVYKAEYIWIDGTEPTAKLRSKTKIVPDGAELPIWGFDGSSTNQATGDKSDCVLKPVFTLPRSDPRRRQRSRHVRGVRRRRQAASDEHPRRARRRRPKKYAKPRVLFGIEQEYTFFKDGRPYGFPIGGFPAPQGGYYCGVGSDEIFGREIVEEHLDNCIEAGLTYSGLNAEVMIGQWEFQIGPLGPLEVGRPAVDRPLAALPHGRGLRRRGDARPQADEGRLERRRGAHQLLDQGDARGRRLQGHRDGLRGARQELGRARQRTTATASRTASPATTRRPRGTSSATACPTAARRSASRCRSSATARATSRTAARTPTSTPTSSPA